MSLTRLLTVLGVFFSRVGGVLRPSPVDLAQIWDAQTLVSFSVSQLDAFGAISSGDCPYLSRAIRCGSRGPKALRERKRSLVWRLIESYLAEEAFLARRQAVSMMRHVWSNYELRAFGKDELRPVSGTGANNWGGIGQTLVDALDTLWLMDFKEEFHRAALWVEQSLSFSKDLNVNLFETSIRHLGGLLSAFALSGRRGLLSKAKDLGNRLIKAFPVDANGRKANIMSGAKSMGVDAKSIGAKFQKLLNQAGLPSEVVDSVLGKGALLSEQMQPSLPSSDINLGSGETKNLAGFISLAEAYVPVEWKYLTALTSNCTYSAAQDQVLHAINRTLNLEDHGLAMIMLTPLGHVFPSPQNRVSLGSRGDSFYEYLLKEAVFAKNQSYSLDPLPKKLWSSFRAKLPELFAEAQRVTRPPGPRWPQKTENASIHRGHGGSLGGWFESWKDAPSPWLFLKEITPQHTVPKMDHLICFLPGAIALQVFHSEEKSQMDLQLAHRLVQTCVHMYWRTVSDLAPEITRFNLHGLVDDAGSMHNILRPETIESLFLLWRTTKRQVYRNWGQRMLCAFYRTKTRFGFASLENVNGMPTQRRDSMPSFFLAETLKYLFLLFSEDSVLPLEDFVLSTEAHPMPILGQNGLGSWPCKGPRPNSMTSGAARSEPTAKAPSTGNLSPPATTPPVSESKRLCDSKRREELQEQIREAERNLQKLRREYGTCVSDPACWQSGYTFENCCFPAPRGNMQCWDVEFTYARCCR
ncbi:2-alpha-mannosidase (ER alpha-1 [Durusdinium trenchii]|uniref:alpha-1,2-Mannosidase n=1 Tax=Durusdinium trenchii TaxID=1381693 RepID=A0ABP0P115_9DINO